MANEKRVKLSLRMLPYAARAAIRKALRFITRHNLLCSREEEKKRLAICAGCPHKIGPIESSTAQCGICFCFLSLKTKFVDEICPDRPKPRW